MHLRRGSVAPGACRFHFRRGLGKLRRANRAGLALQPVGKLPHRIQFALLKLALQHIQGVRVRLPEFRDQPA